MARIAIFQLGYETNTFAEGFAEVADMGSGGFFPGSEVISTFAGKRAGKIRPFDEIDFNDVLVIEFTEFPDNEGLATLSYSSDNQAVISGRILPLDQSVHYFSL